MGGTSRFISLLATPFPTLLNHLRRPSLLHLRRFPSASRRFTVYSHAHIPPLSPINSSQQQQQFHAQPININNNPLNSSSSCFTSHPWPEWCSFISVLTANGQLAPAVEDSFVAYEELSDDFVRAASVCLTFARERPNLIGSLSRRDIEIVVSNGTPFLFKAALETARRMRAFLGIGGSTVLDRDNANTSDLMKYILSYASKPTVSSEKNSLYSRELIESSCRNLLLELVEASCGAPPVNLPSPEQYQFSGRYGQTPRPIRQNLVMKRGDWICQKCNFMNFARNNKCLECEEPRPRRQLTGGEWECPQCYFFNYGRNVVCLKCDFGRPAGVSLGTTHSSSATGYSGNSAYANGIDPRLADNEEKAQRWFSKVSQMNNASDIDSAAADEDFPEIMPLRKGENKFVVSTRKTPLERRLANSQYNMNLGNNVIPEGETSTGAANNIIDTSMKQNMDQISRTSYLGIAADENTESAIYHRGKSSNHVPFVPLPTDMFDKKNQTSVMDEKVNEKVGIFHSPEASHQTSSASVGNDFGMSVEKLQSNRSFSKAKEREQAEKSASWFKKIAELHDVKDLPSAISDDDFPEIMPMRKGENRFVVSKKKDRSLTSPMYKRQVAMEQANNSSFVPFVPFPPGYFAKKDTQQADNADSSSVSRVETSSISSNSYHKGSPLNPLSKTYSETADVEKTHQKSDDSGYKFTDMNTVQRTDDRFTSSRFVSSNFSGDQGFPRIRNIGETSLASDASSTDSSGSRNSVIDDVSPSETVGVGSPQLPGNQNIRSGWTGNSLEGSAVKDPDPLDMSEEAKAERWFRRVAQIKDISELSQIPDEDFPSIMPMRKGVNRFVVSKRKTPIERRLTSTQYRRNLPVVSSDPMKRESDISEK
ncbi:zinc finger protein VAR3, chloroplastic [Nicotiana sylvestris]|uniref:Zinc finger protein VAR3, chloroplastic n=1 Tax=Nicotiana sylvestris TaxID=4096 RepID=A0A1U7XUM6_NICSY|nr:PREDICTED: zinc finger protein VAR3, chloroplastic [Nicotiana sylvestris]